jgi:hypothetical protein
MNRRDGRRQELALAQLFCDPAARLELLAHPERFAARHGLDERTLRGFDLEGLEHAAASFAAKRRQRRASAISRLARFKHFLLHRILHP